MAFHHSVYQQVQGRVVTLAVLLLPLAAPQSNYCGITPEHTMCKYQGIGPACNGNALRRGVTPEEIKEILDSHNRYRAQVARGEEKRGRPGPQPPAANMKLLEWDQELATVAQRHADQCVFAHDCSDCRKVDRYGTGQNLYIYKQTLRLGATNWAKGITDWYEEVTLHSNKKVEPFKFDVDVGHYTQLVWADTEKIGCGSTSFPDGKFFTTLYTCNYGPNGNIQQTAMYKQGPACSQCPDGYTCSKEYPGICGKSNPGDPNQASSPPESPEPAQSKGPDDQGKTSGKGKGKKTG